MALLSGQYINPLISTDDVEECRLGIILFGYRFLKVRRGPAISRVRDSALLCSISCSNVHLASIDPIDTSEQQISPHS